MSTTGAAGRLLRELVDGGAMSRAEATARAAVSRSAAGTAVEELLRLGLIRADLPLANGRGRPSSMLTLRADGAAVVACEVGTHETVIATHHLDGTLDDRKIVALDVPSMAPEESVVAVAAHLRQRVETVGPRCVGVGVSIPGMINRATGVATLVLPLNWRNVHVRDILERELQDMYVTVGQDALLAALAEFHLGAGASADRMLLLIAEAVGLGGAIVGLSSGQQPANHSLQAGHVIVDPRGPRCVCGAAGCLEMYADGRAFVRALGLGRGATPADVSAAVAAGLDDNALRALTKEIVVPFTTGLVSLVNALGPDRVVLAGLLAELPRLAGVRLEEVLAQSVVATAERVSVVPAELDDGVLRGAAYDAFSSLFRDPSAAIGARLTEAGTAVAGGRMDKEV
ncbi:ROK family protein [Georgenia satyanarayanai]|uniref:ROK family protein n=1 Tax=Georgenia satyanarayanai TaxID=860221 RepID=UPI00203B72A2|nr:ROK family protein [Georgenia satyanarayanai]MCM3661395.1 ROK family protein [Georgenia satyanarayanai]